MGWVARLFGSSRFFSMALRKVVSAVLIDSRVQLSLAFIPPMSFPSFDWVCGGIAWSLNAGL